MVVYLFLMTVTRQISTQTLDNFLTRLEQGYSKFENPYHNLIHAADVTQTTYHLFSQSGLVVSCLLYVYVIVHTHQITFELR